MKRRVLSRPGVYSLLVSCKIWLVMERLRYEKTWDWNLHERLYNFQISFLLLNYYGLEIIFSSYVSLIQSLGTRIMLLEDIFWDLVMVFSFSQRLILCAMMGNKKRKREVYSLLIVDVILLDILANVIINAWTLRNKSLILESHAFSFFHFFWRFQT